MRNSKTWLRISYWVGAIADGLVALAMFGEMIIGHASPLTQYIPEVPYRYAIGLAGSLMFGWTILLLWADRKPIERRDVLLLTCVVVVGLMGSGIFAMLAGFVPIPAGSFVLVFQILLIALFSASYYSSKRQDP
jgi:hypothetical protein